ncbi:MAG: tRNA (guanosine(37)-N1)-methyltransferase TrmD [Myxococcales bacterium]|nr:MAG: tRNA (guanosine(37)-N1)-methyltransferase TrmD [Myxococcales bacterium]
MQVGIVTLFPELFTQFFKTSLMGRATESGVVHIHYEDLRPHGLGKHRSVDDTPYGGGSGMVMRADCVVAAMDAAATALGEDGVPAHRILLTPQGRRFTQVDARRLAEKPKLVLTCGRYEGFDERVRSFVDEELSLGDFVVTGGEVPAMCLLEAVIRLLPGVLGNGDSAREESFSEECGGLLEYPHYTRPVSFRGMDVPEVLRNGDHAKIKRWREEQAHARSAARRPELLVESRGRTKDQS